MEYLISPWAHQREAIERAKGLPEFALLYEMGCGKSATLINILRHKFKQEGRLLKTLILGPPIVVENWRREWGMHSKISPHHIVPLVGPGAKRSKTLETSQASIFITNYESLLMRDLYSKLLAWGPEVLVLDESHKCKDMKSKRTKLALGLAKDTRYRYILSGTAVLNSPLDLFSQFLILDLGTTFGGNFFAFRARFMEDKNAGMPKHKYFPNWQIKPKALEEISKMIASKSIRAKKEDCLDLPPFVQQTIYVEMAPEQKRLYGGMRKDLITFFKDEACVATLAITKALRLMQIASGYVKTTDSTHQLEDTPKMDALRELLKELTPSHKVLIWAVFIENYAQIRKVCEELEVEYVEVHGGISAVEKQKAVDRLSHDARVRVLIGHPLSCGLGINLTAASYSIFYSRNFSLEQDLQAEARNYRGGSKEAGHLKITRIDLVAKDTIEEEIVKKLALKENIGETVLRGLIASGNSEA